MAQSWVCRVDYPFDTMRSRTTINWNQLGVKLRTEMKTIFPKPGLAKKAVVQLARLYSTTLPRPTEIIPPTESSSLRILVHSQGGIGNTLMATPLLAGMRLVYPNAQIDLLVPPVTAELLKSNTRVNRIISDQGGYDYSLRRYLQKVREIYKTRYDAVVQPLNAIVLRFAIRSAIARVPVRISHRYNFDRLDDFSFIHSRTIAKESGVHDVVNNMQLLELLSGTSVCPGPLELSVSNREIDAFKQSAPDEFMSASYRVGIFPGSSTWMSFKRWPIDKYIALAKEICSSLPGSRICVFYRPDEDRSDISNWKSEIDCNRLQIFDSLSLDSYAAAVSQLNIVIANDSLPMHLACALQRPVVALFGPTDPVATGPWMSHSRIVTPSEDYPPYFRMPYPLHPAQFPNYMDAIPVERVMTAVTEILATPSTSDFS